MSLLGRKTPDTAAAAAEATGVLPAQALQALVSEGTILADAPLVEGQIQPASIDLRLGPRAYRVRASFLPGAKATVGEKIDAYQMHAIDLSQGAVLERGCVYIVPLMEALDLPDRLTGMANPKSSTGRLDIFTRLITDYATAFDRIDAGYTGPLYAEIAPRTFSVLARQGDRLSQLRLRRGRKSFGDRETQRLHDRIPLAQTGDGAPVTIADGVALTIDLHGADESGLIGYRARHHAPLIDLSQVGIYEADDYWEPIYRGRGGTDTDSDTLVLNPDDFYILASREAVTIPPDHAAEMVPYDTLVGEFRVHYAGFFDPGFGYAEAGGSGTRAVLEVRSHDVPFLLEHGQTIGRLVYEPMTQVPDQLYGVDIGSNYQQQTLALAKQFKR